MSEVVQFALSKRWLALLAVSLSVSVLLFFFAGLLAGLWLSKPPVLLAAPARRSLPKPVKSDPSPPIGQSPLASSKPPLDLAAAPGRAKLAVQVANFDDLPQARSFADALKRQGFPLLPLATIRLAGKTWNTVQVGPYSDWDTAARAASDLKHSYSLDTFVVQHTAY